MARRQIEWAHRERERLLWLFGNKCRFCGATEDLQFDCIRPMGDAHHRKNANGRMLFYRKQFKAGNLQVLCGKCNAEKGGREG